MITPTQATRQGAVYAYRTRQSRDFREPLRPTIFALGLMACEAAYRAATNNAAMALRWAGCAEDNCEY